MLHSELIPWHKVCLPFIRLTKIPFREIKSTKKKIGLDFTLFLLRESSKKLILINIQDVDMFCYQNHNSLSRLQTIVENVTQVSMQHVMVIHSYMCPS